LWTARAFRCAARTVPPLRDAPPPAARPPHVGPPPRPAAQPSNPALAALAGALLDPLAGAPLEDEEEEEAKPQEPTMMSKEARAMFLAGEGTAALDAWKVGGRRRGFCKALGCCCGRGACELRMWGVAAF
jgi:hypothetical protein